MKHFPKLALAAGLVLSAATAQATVEFQLTIDNPDYVKVSVDWSEIEVAAGTTTMALDDFSNFSIESRNSSQHILQEVLVDGVNQLTSLGSSFYRNQYNLSELNGTEIKVHSSLIDDMRTGTFTVTVDNPARLSYVSTNGYPSSQVKLNELVAGEPYTVHFIPDLNTTISFNSNGGPLYKVLKNGEELTPDSYGSYSSIEIEEGMSMEVFGNYPDIMSNLTFNFQGEAANLFSHLYIYGDASTGFAKTEVEVVDNQAQVPIGSQIIIEFTPDYNNYIFNSFKVGAKEITNIYLTTQQYITDEEVEILLDAELSEPVNVTFNVTGAEGLVVNRKEASDILTFSEGSNPVTLYATNLELTIKSYPTYEIESVYLDGEEQNKSWNGDYRFYTYNSPIHDGSVIDIVASAKNSYKAYITVEDASLVVLKRNRSQWCEETIALQNGRNELVCTDGNNSFYLEASSTGYINGVNMNFDEDVVRNWYGAFEFTVDADYEVMVTAEPIVKEGEFILYIDDLKSKNLSSFSWTNNIVKDNDKTLESGYNVCNFFHAYNPFKTQAYFVYGEPVTYALYVNDERQEVTYPSYPSNEINLAIGDVVKVYLTDDDPQFYQVTFGNTFENITYDVIKSLEDTSAAVSVLKGTRFDFQPVLPDDGNEYGVFVNSEFVEPGEDGLYHVEIFEDTDIVLSNLVGVAQIEAKDAEMYFTVDGVRLYERPTASGIYIRVKGNRTSKIVVR